MEGQTAMMKTTKASGQKEIKKKFFFDPRQQQQQNIFIPMSFVMQFINTTIQFIHF